MKSLWSAISDRWNHETDGAGLALVRIVAAIAVMTEMLDACLFGGVSELIVEPQVNFKYAFLTWIGRPQGLMPYVLAWVLVALGTAVLVGWRTRWTAGLLALGYCYWFSLDASNYTDRGYLVCLLLILCAWLPTNRWASIDSYLRRESRTQVPGWTVELMRTQLLLVSFFFGLALLNTDWLNGAPLLAWVETEAASNSLAALLSGKPGLILAIAWIIPLVSLAIEPLLLWKRTRLGALLAVALWHAFDQLTFQISVAPIILTFANLVFCDPATIRSVGNRIASWLQRIPLSQPIWQSLCGLGWVIDATVNWFDDTPLLGKGTATRAMPQRVAVPPTTVRQVQPASVGAQGIPQWIIAGWLLLQIGLPLRYLTVETNPDWSDMATTFAWRGQHRDKQCELKLSVIQPSQELAWPLDPSEEFPVPLAIFYTPEKLESLRLSEGLLKDLVSGPPATFAERVAGLNLPEQEAQRILANSQASVALRLAGHQYEQVVQRPELIRQYAHQVAQVLSRLLGEQVQVQAELMVKLNHRPAESLFKMTSSFDLAEIPTAYELSTKLTGINSPLPAPDQRIAYAKEWAELRRIELEQNFDIDTPQHPQQKGEPTKLPALSDEDERWFQEKYGLK